MLKDTTDAEVTAAAFAIHLPAISRIYSRFVAAGFGLSDQLHLVSAGEAVPFARLEELLREAPATGICKLYGRWTRALDAIIVEKAIAAAADPLQRARLLSVRNEMGGLWLVDCRVSVANMVTAVWRVAARMRLGLAVLDTDEVPLCGHRFADGRGQCQHRMDALGVHPVACAVGSGRIARHSAIAMLVWRMCREAGFHARREVLMPCWRRMRGGKSQQAIMDICASGHVSLRDRHIDITVRHSLCEVYAPRNARVPGAALEVAEREKEDRYPTAVGMHCTPAALESYGRMGPAFGSLIADLCSGASEDRVSRGLPARSPRRRWLAELSVLFAVHCAGAVISGREPCSGTDQQSASAGASC